MRKNVQLLVMSAIGVGILASGLLWYSTDQRTAQPQAPNTPLKTDMDGVLQAVQSQVLAAVPDYHANGLASGDWLANLPKDGDTSVPDYEYKVYSEYAPSANFYAEDLSETWNPAKGMAIHTVSDVLQALSPAFRAQGFQAAAVSDAETTGRATEYRYYRSGESCITDTRIRDVRLNCSSPDLDRQRAARGKPLIKAYQAAHQGLKADSLILGAVQIKSQGSTRSVITASYSSGHDIAEAQIHDPMGDHIALFYRVGSGGWHYVTRASDEYGFPCDDMKRDPSARIALHDQICYQNDTGQVRLDTAEQALR